ncbi:MAG: SIMPL domain-containing protein, partial [Anaerolineae bacterium]|nr:SIMPL domain-containing protein [Anaerolineae bacterium]
MKTRNTLNTLLLVIVAGLLLLNWNSARPTAVPAARTAVAEAADAQPSGSITVSGSSAVRVQPDRVVVVLGVETFARTPSASRDANARLSKAVLTAIRVQGVADKDIATANLTLQPRYDDYDWNVISGYASRNTIAVTLRDVEKLEPVLVAALEAGATSVDGVEFSVTNLRELR